jgi:hypothetical protein
MNAPWRDGAAARRHADLRDVRRGLLQERIHASTRARGIVRLQEMVLLKRRLEALCLEFAEQRRRDAA